jgi:hypothetical protein
MGLVNLQPICYNKDMHQNVANVIGANVVLISLTVELWYLSIEPGTPWLTLL